jgi:hypothetical protein
VGGQYLESVSAARVFGPGIRAKIIEHTKPLTPGQAGMLRERLMELMKRGRDPNSQKEIAEIRKMLAAFVRRPAAPAIAETVLLQVTLDGDAPAGERELRLTTAMGVSNPLTFCVGQLSEYSPRWPKADDVVEATRAIRTRNDPARATPSGPTVDVTLPITVNGQVLPGEVDRYRFQAVKGQRLVISAAARKLVPYIADAVPGWFQAVMALQDANGREVSYSDGFRFSLDPVIGCEVPRSGAYTLEIRDALYRGREDFVYRVSIGVLPLITGIFPRGAKAGTQTLVELKGWNLPATSVVFDARGKAPGIWPLQVSMGPWASNSLPLAVDSLSEYTEKAAAGPGARDAQPLTLPVIVNGRIERPGQADVFSFDGKAGEEVVAEVFARRLDSPMDSALRLTDAAGRQIAANDDHEDKGSGLNTHHADSYIRTKLPAGGTYFLYVHDVQQQAGPECSYRLRVGPPQPDFQLRIAPSAVNVRAGVSAPVAVHALRRDGFAGEIELVLKDAPPGYKLSGGLIPAGQDQVRLSITAPALGARDLVTPTVEGRARIDGRQVVHAAVPAEDMMQAFAYRHLVAAQELAVAVARRGPARADVRILSLLPVKIRAGGTAGIRVTLPTSTLFADFELELSDPPAGVSIRKVSSALVGSEIVFAADADRAKPGTKGNLIVNLYMVPRRPGTPPPATPVSATRPASTPSAAPAPTAKSPAGPTTRATTAPTTAPAKPPTPAAPPRRPLIGVLPAIPFEIVQR